MRRISLATRIVAPIVIGQILSRTSHPVGALVVAGWNFMTIFLEYFLLWKIYNDVPQLHRLKIRGMFVYIYLSCFKRHVMKVGLSFTWDFNSYYIDYHLHGM